MSAPEPPQPPPRPSSAGGRDVWDDRIARSLAFVRRRLSGDYQVDEFGFDPELADAVFLPLLRRLYRHWFRTELAGVAQLPAHGPALVVANHSGTVALDALMLAVAVREATGVSGGTQGRHLRLLGADFLFRTPVVSDVARKSGVTLACHADAERLLHAGELVGVFPEGIKGVGKHFRDRYRLQRFGRGGFVSAALRTRAPIVPAAIVGAEEIYPKIGNIAPLARLLGLPYFPVTPTFPWLGPLGMIPLPSKWLIEFGEPVDTAPWTGQADDPMVVFHLADQVRERIQQSLRRLLARRPDPFAD